MAAATSVISLSATAWTKVAEAAGDVKITADDALWAMTATDSAPTINVGGVPVGHAIESDKPMAATMVSGEYLWLRGSGFALLTADNAV